MKIISVPHNTLRKQAKEVKAVDKKILAFMSELSKTLLETSDPPGVGLAAPQVDVEYRIFATYMNHHDTESDADREMRVFINPLITDVSKKIVFGHDKDREPRLEGCLSIPGLYGVVPRYQWVDLSYQYLEHGELKSTQERFTEFSARVIQHEYDHLEGILYTDYSLEYDLPVYKENPKTKKLEEIDKTILEAF